LTRHVSEGVGIPRASHSNSMGRFIGTSWFLGDLINSGATTENRKIDQLWNNGKMFTVDTRM
jgi:hypothetical protein